MPTSLPSFKEILSLSLSLHIMYFSYLDLYVCSCGIIVHSHSHNHCTVGARVFYHRHQEFMGHGLCREDEFSWPTPFVSHRTAVSSSKLQTVVPSGLANIKKFFCRILHFLQLSVPITHDHCPLHQHQSSKASELLTSLQRPVLL